MTFGANQQSGISVFHTGNKTLQLSGPQINGLNAAGLRAGHQFPAEREQPHAGDAALPATGSTPGLRTATFSFSTNSPNTPNVSAGLICNAVAQPVSGEL